MPKACKEVFHPCAKETMHIIIFLLVVLRAHCGRTAGKAFPRLSRAILYDVVHGSIVAQTDRVAVPLLGPSFDNRELRVCTPPPHVRRAGAETSGPSNKRRIRSHRAPSSNL